MSKHFITALLFILFSFANAQEKKNILFIAVDDLKPLLSNYGNKQIKTPNFDRLAAMGATFTNAHANQAVCGPSRASILTGTCPDMTQVWDLHTDFRISNPELVSMPEYLITQGYETTAIGKLYHKGSTSPGHDSKSWSVPHAQPEGNDPKLGKPAFEYYHNPSTKAEFAKLEAELTASGKNKGNNRNALLKKLKPSNESADVSDEGYQDGMYALEAVKMLGTLSKGSKPFFLGVGFQRPHLPFVAPKKYWDLYDRKDIQIDPQQTKGSNIPEIAYHTYGELKAYTDIPDDIQLGETLPVEKQKELVHGYMACVSYVDAQLGKLLDAYFKLGLDKNTIIVLWGDHGFHLGDHTIWCKHSNFEQATRVPLMFAGPGVSKGINVSNPVELLDVFPTLFQLTNVPQHKQLEGVNLAPLMDSDKSTNITKDYAISQYDRKKTVKGYSIRTDRYRYTEWHDNKYNSQLPYNDGNIVAYELYDYINDPQESKSYHDDASYTSIKYELKSKLKNHLNAKEKLYASTSFPTVEHKAMNNDENDDDSKSTKKQSGGKKNGSRVNKKDKSNNKGTGKGIDKKKDNGIGSADASSDSSDQVQNNNNQEQPSKSNPKIITNKKPNVLIIHIDDLGYHDLGCTGSDIYDTPNIDKLAKESMAFKQAYSSYPRCTPSRYAMMTSTYPVNEDHGHLASIPESSNFIKQFKKQGYQSSYVGKWHLGGGENAPKGYGFDHSFAAGEAGGAGSHFYPFNVRVKQKGGESLAIEDVTEAGKEGDYLMDLLTDQTISFIKNADKSKPFFAVLSPYAVHTPLEAKPSDKERNESEIAYANWGGRPEYIREGEGRRKMRQDDADYAGMVENMDFNVGRLLRELRALGLEENTIIVFSSDHGGLSNDGNKNERHLATTNFPLKAGKGHLYEGGIRIPFFVKWKNQIKPGVDNKSIVLGMDVMPTLLDLATDQSLSNVDGRSFENVLMKKENWDDRTVFWHEKKARPYSTGDIPCTVIRSGKYKLMHFFEIDQYELYDLSTDISEEKNIIDTQPEIAQKLKAELVAWKSKYLTSAQVNKKKAKDKSQVEGEDNTDADTTTEDPKADKKAAKKAAKKAERKASKSNNKE